jgi:N-acetylglucosamine-6-sulfatase
MIWRALIVLALAAGGLLGPRAAAQPARPDIIVILTDDMRADDWQVLTETERLVGGTWYPNFIYTTPLCCPTRATIQRGQYAHNTGVRTNQDGNLFGDLDDDTIATALDAEGYRTVYVGKFMNDYRSRAPGWDVWETRLGNPEVDDAGEDKDAGGEDKYWVGDDYSTDVVRDRAVGAITQSPTDQPIFLFVGVHAPHTPAVPAPRHQDADVAATPTRKDLDRQRKRTLLAVDEAVVAIAEAMGPRWEEACVFVLSDNGYLVGEHETTGKSDWWDGATRVPLRARCPGLGSGTDDRLVRTIDLAPTILHAAGATMRHELDGRALQEAWEREGILVESWDEENAGHPRPAFSAIKGKGWLYVEVEGATPQLYRDPAELVDSYLMLAEPERAMYTEWLAALKSCAAEACRTAEQPPE